MGDALAVANVVTSGRGEQQGLVKLAVAQVADRFERIEQSGNTLVFMTDWLITHVVWPRACSTGFPIRVEGLRGYLGSNEGGRVVYVGGCRGAGRASGQEPGSVGC